MWLIKCASGCSTSISTPGASSLIRSRTLRKNLVALRFRFRIHAEDVFADVDWRCMFVHLGSTRSANEVQNLAVGILVRLLHRLKHRVDRAGDLVGRIERRAGRQRHVDLDAAFVERRQEVSPKLRHLPGGDANGEPSQNQQRTRHRHAESNQIASPILSSRAEETHRLRGAWLADWAAE